MYLSADLIRETKALNAKHDAANDMAGLFNEISRIADKVSDPDLKAQLKGVAATGRKKLELMK